MTGMLTIMQWNLSTFETSQAVCPQDTASLQVNFKGTNNLTVLPANGYFWVIMGTNGIYTFISFPLAKFRASNITIALQSSRCRLHNLLRPQ